jgi:NAD-dependent SIR2 family protein deacetylase
VELHGGLDRVRCLSCGERTARQALDQRLRAANADWDAIAGTMNRTAMPIWPTSLSPASG